MVVAGLVADGRQLVNRAREEATNYKNSYGEEHNRAQATGNRQHGRNLIVTCSARCRRIIAGLGRLFLGSFLAAVCKAVLIRRMLSLGGLHALALILILILTLTLTLTLTLILTSTTPLTLTLAMDNIRAYI